jgi:hypothetical protein
MGVFQVQRATFRGDGVFEIVLLDGSYQIRKWNGFDRECRFWEGLLEDGRFSSGVELDHLVRRFGSFEEAERWFIGNVVGIREEVGMRSIER